jgi:hypothetical protein
MLSFLKKFFGSKPTVSPCPEVPYKVEAPTPVAKQATQAAVESIAPAKKKPAAKKPAGEKKPAVRAKTTRAKKQAS